MKKRFKILSAVFVFVLCASMLSFAVSASDTYDIGDKTYIIDEVIADGAALGMRSELKDSESLGGYFYLEPTVKPTVPSNSWLVYDFTVEQGPGSPGAHVKITLRFGEFGELQIQLDTLDGYEDGFTNGSHKGIVQISNHITTPEEEIPWYGTLVIGGALYGGRVTVNQYEIVTLKEAVTATVNFMDHRGNAYAQKKALLENGAGYISELPPLPQRRGYITTGWNNFTTDTIVTEDITVYPSFSKDPEFAYTISSTNGSVYCPGHTAQDGKFTVNYEDRVVADAPETDGENAFSYWTVNGVKWSTEQRFSFYASGDAELTAVYQGAIEPAPFVTLNPSSALELDANGKFEWTTFAQTYLPEGYTLQECGVLFAAGNHTENLQDLQFDTHVTTVKHVSTAKANQQYIGRLLSIGGLKQRSARAYMIVEKDGGVSETIYSENAIVISTPTDTTTFDKQVRLTNGDYSFTDTNNGLMDGEMGNVAVIPCCNNGSWMGLEGEDLTILVPLGRMRTFTQLQVGFLMEYDMGVNYPSSVKYSVSKNGVDFTEYDTVPIHEEYWGIQKHNALTQEKTVTAGYVKIEITNPGVLPDGHPAAGSKTWIFFDELTIVE